ncbi:hypothetical protein [Tsukamurella paurometabola]|uniref:Uncharacterized protein n=1 Tax=Tsukamurella paurometabola TaxID=2061 RepID=A0ABS5NEY0_TSUPA|nr:hypothetical protein [Tsukamurella paurometabola]MBS4102856.1 hypothetical protein [Tsukamurella paurometabola]
MLTDEERIDNTLYLAGFCDRTLTRDHITLRDGATYVRGQRATEFLAEHSVVVPNDPIPVELEPEVQRIIKLGRQRGVEVDRDFFYVLSDGRLLYEGTNPEERIEELVAEASRS